MSGSDSVVDQRFLDGFPDPSQISSAKLTHHMWNNK